MSASEPERLVTSVGCNIFTRHVCHFFNRRSHPSATLAAGTLVLARRVSPELPPGPVLDDGELLGAPSDS